MPVTVTVTPGILGLKRSFLGQEGRTTFHYIEHQVGGGCLAPCTLLFPFLGSPRPRGRGYGEEESSACFWGQRPWHHAGCISRFHQAYSGSRVGMCPGHRSEAQ